LAYLISKTVMSCSDRSSITVVPFLSTTYALFTSGD
jgi:hypothetical protein